MNIVLRKGLVFLVHLLVMLVGLVFLYSAYTKLDPVIETFEMAFIKIGVASWNTSPWIARFVIGMEIATGFLLILQYNLKKTVLWALVFLMIFNSYLLFLIINGSNQENCGCFGEVIWMSPGQAMLKNTVMILLLLPVFWLDVKGWKINKYKKIFFIIFLTVCFTLPHILNPVFYDERSIMDAESIGMTLPFELLYEQRDREKVDSVTVDFRKGKHAIAFLSLTCPHCRIAAKKIRLMKDINPSLPFYFILNGEKSKLNEFLHDTKCDDIPRSFVLGKTFVKLAGTNLPRIYLTENGVLKMKKNHVTLRQDELEEFLKNR